MTEADKTKDRIMRALALCERRAATGDEKLSIREVARQAGVSNALIHNRYPELAEKIRRLQGRGAREVVAEAKDELKDALRLVSELRADNERLRKALEAFGRQNHRLDTEKAVFV